MKTSQAGIDLIKHFESLHDGDLSVIGLQPKMDCAGIWTEGYGRAMRDDHGNFIQGADKKELAYSRQTIHDEKEAEIALHQDLSPMEFIVSKKITVPFNQNQFDALVSYVYNTGGSSTLYSLINSNAPKEQITNWFENHYIMSCGKVYQGLIIRRKTECELYFKPV